MMLIEDRSLTRANEEVLGVDLPGTSRRISTRAPSTRTPTWVPISAVGTEYRAEPRRIVDSLSTLRLTGAGDERAQRGQLGEQVHLLGQPLVRDGGDL